MSRLFLFSMLFALFSCKKDTHTAKSSFELLGSEATGIKFENKVVDQEQFNILTYRNYYNGGGVAIGDLNNDGLNDIFFTANMSDNKLYLNKGDMKFEDLTARAGIKGKNAWCTGVTMADVNADGYLDIYVCYSGDSKNDNKDNELYINNKNLTFTEKAKEYGLNDSGLSTHASFFDFDLDGDLDCYVLNNSYKDPERISLYSRQRFDYDAAGGDRLYRNDTQDPQHPVFTNITKESGIFSSDIGFGLGISVGDVNGDLYPDIYISNDFWERDYLYLNQKNGKFKESLTENISYTSTASMGSDMADINNDGHLDIFSTDMLPPGNERQKAAQKFDDYYLYDIRVQNSYYYQFVQNCLQVNRGDGTFQETAHFSGVSATDWSWGALIFDMNLDGKKDIFVSNGVYHDITDSDFIDFIGNKDQVRTVVEQKGKYDFRDFVKYLPHNQQKNFAFINQGGLNFINEAQNLNLDQDSYSNGSAYGDLDNDGDLDLVVNNVNMEAFVYKNKAVEDKSGYFVKFKLQGSEKNTFGIGAAVWLYSNGEKQLAHSMTARGFQSSVDPSIYFGLGQNATIDSVRIIWPDLKTELLQNTTINKTFTLDYKNAKNVFVPSISPLKTLFTSSTLPGADHLENNYVDYDSERLMPHVFSTDSPKLIKGDVNGDGKEDFILQGAKNSPDKLFINNGISFVLSPQTDFELNKKYESLSGALFDADGDKDLDYLVGLGGNEFRDGIESFRALYYVNDGKGKFAKNFSSPLAVLGQIGCVKPCDFDLDGDMDVFMGGKSLPGAYGLTPRSYLLQNDSYGVWNDITDQYTGPLGMVTDAVWSDINADQLPDLLVVGEWMPITVFVNEKGKLQKPLTIPNSEGWWNTIEAADIDNDGDLDYLCGNWGTNMKLRATLDKPMNMYVADFDDNKRNDFLLEWYTLQDKIPYPFASKSDLTAQLPMIKKKAVKYHDYAKLQIKDLIEEEKLKKAVKKTVVNFSSAVLLNNKGSLELQNLLPEGQMSPIFAFETGDFDGDGKTDFMASGNFYRLKPEIGRHDGFNGGYFKGLGQAKFKFIPSFESGLTIKGEVRDAITIDKKLLISRNNDKLLVFTKNKN